MVHKGSYSVALVVCWFLLATTALFGADPTKAKDWIEQLRNPIPAVRVQAATKLAELGRLGELAETAIEPLAKCLQDTDANVRLYAAFALGRIEADTERSLILLVPLLADRDEHVHYSAEWSISEIAKRLSVREISAEDALRLSPIFESAERELAKAPVQERHLQAVRLARTRLQNPVKSVVTPTLKAAPEPSLPEPPPLPAVPEPKQPAAPMEKTPMESLDVTLSLYKANDFVGRLQIVERMANETEFNDNLRLGILKYELQTEYYSSVATYAISRWQTSAQNLLFQLFSELQDGELNEQYAEGLISRLKPTETPQLESICKIAMDSQRSSQLRLTCLNTIQSAILQSHIAPSIATTIVPSLMSLVENTTESDELRCSAIEMIAMLNVNAKVALPILMDSFAQPQHSDDVRAAIAAALAKLAPESQEAAGSIAAFMKSLRNEDSLYATLAATLGDFGSTGVVGMDRLVEGLRSSEEATRLGCALALAKIGDSASRAATFLVARVIDPNETIAVKSQAATAIKRMGPNAVKLLSEQIQNPEAIVREHVLRALSQADDSNHLLLDPYLSVLTDTYEKGPVRAAAATALGSLGQVANAAVPALLKCCVSDQPELRAAAILAVARIAPGQATVVVQNGLIDVEPIVRASASFGLHLCGDTAASLESMLQLLDGPESQSLVLEMLADIGPSLVTHAMAIAESRDRSIQDRLCCVQASASMPNAPWPALVRLLKDDEIGDRVAILLESSDLFETDKAPLLLGLLRDGHVETATRNRIMTVIEAEGFGAGDDENRWANTLAINQPEAARALSSRQERESISAMRSSIAPSPVNPPRATAPKSSSSPPKESTSEFVPKEAKKRLPPSKSPEEEADRKVSVFYGTNRAPIVAAGLQMQIGLTHVCLAAGLLAAMVGCFFVFPRHSNIRYAIASLVGMGTVSTIALQIIFITNGQGDTERVAYGGKYSEQVQYGVCEVSIPVVHQPGELEAPQLFKLEIKPDLEKHVVLTHVGRLDQDAFHAALQTEMDRKGKNIFVFIHGYNVSFEDAARRTGQMAYDLKFPGAPVFYSWPSQANWYSYGTDQENIELSTTQIRDFLVDIATRSNADTVNLIAHSMGNVGLTAALSEIEKGSKPHFNQVVLAAPDIDADRFKNEIATKIVTKARRTTLYTSKTDLALIASRYFNNGDRAGDSGSQVVILDGIETIDATAVDSSLLGHSYYGSNVTVLDDLGQLLQNQPISSRSYLKLIEAGPQSYWAFEPMLISRTPSLVPEQRR